MGFSGVSGIALFRGSWGFMDFRGLPEITLLRGSGGGLGILEIFPEFGSSGI